MRAMPPEPMPYRPLIPRWGKTVLYWRIVFCCRKCEQTVARSAEKQEHLIGLTNMYKARLFEAWKAARQQNKGMNRMARKIKRLQAELAALKASTRYE